MLVNAVLLFGSKLQLKSLKCAMSFSYEQW